MITSINEFKQILNEAVNAKQLKINQKYKILSGLGGMFVIVYKGFDEDKNKHKFYHPKTSHGFGGKYYYYTTEEIPEKITKYV